jgi:hypothetical protein
MNILGYSTITQIGSYEVARGVTGNTGPTGPTGPQGTGLTGNTGINVVGVTLIDRSVFTTFSDGTTYTTPNTAIGGTGTYTYLIDYLNSGSGVSLAHSVTGSSLVLRPIRISTTDQNKVLITTEADKVTVNVSPKTISGLTLNALSESDSNLFLLKLTGNKFRRTQFKPQEVSTTGVGVPMAHFFERVRGMGWTGSTAAVNCVSTTSGITCTLNPFVLENDAHMFNMRSKVFVGDFEGNTASIIIAPCPTTNEAYSFDLYINNAKNPTALSNRFTSSSPILWPRNKIPCFEVAGGVPTIGGCDLKVTFFGLNGVWYATTNLLGTTCSHLVGQEKIVFSPNCFVLSAGALPNGGDENVRGGEVPLSFFVGVYSTDSSIQGACCKRDGTCEITNAYLCDGYFHGYGTTCGATYSSICDKVGACCVNPGYGNNVYTCNQLSCIDCVGITGGIYAGNDTLCTTTDCSIIATRIGACCDGLGGCQQLSEIECVQRQGFYQGNGSGCFSGSISVCSTGTGPCCINGECNQSSASDCFSSNGYFLGKGRSCSEFTCPDIVSCLGYINGIPLTPGQYYGGGIIVGKFEPGKSEILGARQLFDPTAINIVGEVTTYTSQAYTSFLDHTAYGITKDCSFDNESYIIVVYPRDLAVDGQETFAWGGTGSSWGPILDSGGNYNDFVLNNNPDDISSSPIKYANTHLAYTEGYWSTGSTAINTSLISNTFQTCNSATIYGIRGVERVFAKSPYSLHGYWHHSWGLYNTIRVIHSQNVYNKRVSVSPIFNWTEYPTYAEKTAFDGIRLLPDGVTSNSQGVTANSGALSGWYLPSHDEMAFIASNTSSTFGFNVNQTLMLTPDGQPLNGLYWTSTGTFDYSKSEGIYDGNTKPLAGSVAISMQFDVNGSDYRVVKSSRQEKLKVRPIRMIRCDGKTPANRYLWFIPSVLSSSNKNINQRNIDILNIESI